MTRARRATLHEVAAEAGVSVAVVSLVLNGKDRGKFLPETVQRVHDSSARLGYRADRRAVALTTGKSGLIGLIVPDVSNPFFAAVQMGILDALGSSFQLLTVTTADDRIGSENVQAALDLGVDGLLVTARHAAIDPTPPTVILDLPGEGDGHARVNLDVASTARELAHHMISLGHRRVVYLTAVTPSATLTDRHLTFERTFASRGGSVTSEGSALSIEAAERLVAERWPVWRDSGVTAIVCALDLQAYGCFAALRDAGAEVPQDVSLIGGDDLPYSRLLTPPLATVSLPARELGRVGATRLMEHIATRNLDAGSVVTLPTELRLRGSLGRARDTAGATPA